MPCNERLNKEQRFGVVGASGDPANINETPEPGIANSQIQLTGNLFSAGQLPANVGIASRLVNQEPGPVWNPPLSQQDIHAHRFGGSFEHFSPFAYTFVPQQSQTVFSLRNPLFASSDFQNGTSPYGNTNFIGGYPSHAVTVMNGLQSPPFNSFFPRTSLPSQDCLPTNLTFPTHSSAMHFQYPLHHLTGTALMPASVSPFPPLCSPPFLVAVNGFTLPVQCERPSCSPVPQTPLSPRAIHPPLSRQSLPCGSPHSSYRPLNSHDQPYVSDGFDPVLPQDLSVKSVTNDGADDDHSVEPECGTSSSNKSAGCARKRHFGSPFVSKRASAARGTLSTRTIADILLEALRDKKASNSEMDRAAAEWNKVADNEESDCWSFMQSFQQRKEVQDKIHIEVRSLLSRMPEDLRDALQFPKPKSIPSDILKSIGMRRMEQRAMHFDHQMPVECADVDPSELLRFSQQLTSVTLSTEIDLRDSNEDSNNDILRSVGLVDKDVLPVEQTARSSPKRNQKKLSSKASNLGRREAMAATLARESVKAKMRNALDDLAAQILRLKQKVSAVKKLAKDEAHRDDLEIPRMVQELETIITE